MPEKSVWGGNMGIPRQAIDICKLFEGFHREARLDGRRMAAPYICPAGYWTIGYGHLCAENHPPITIDQAEAYLAADLTTAVEASLRYCPVLAAEPDNRLAAIASFTFNLGAGRLQTSTLRRRVNDRDWEGAGEELLRWTRGGGRVLPGLVKRRAAERELLLAGGAA